LRRPGGFVARVDFALGQTLEKLGRVADAKQLYQRGIEVTKTTGDGHTRSELEGALALLG